MKKDLDREGQNDSSKGTKYVRSLWLKYTFYFTTLYYLPLRNQKIHISRERPFYFFAVRLAKSVLKKPYWKVCEHSWNQICFHFEERKSWNTVNDSQLFIRLALKSKMNRLLEEGDISEKSYQYFFWRCQRFLTKFCSAQIKKVTLSWQKPRARAFCQIFLDVSFFILQATFFGCKFN